MRDIMEIRRAGKSKLEVHYSATMGSTVQTFHVIQKCRDIGEKESTLIAHWAYESAVGIITNYTDQVQ